MKFLRARLAAKRRPKLEEIGSSSPGAGEMRGRETKIQASPDRCRLYATLNRTSEHLYCFRVLGSIRSGPGNQIRLPAVGDGKAP